jgi:hypothetical protein
MAVYGWGRSIDGWRTKRARMSEVEFTRADAALRGLSRFQSRPRRPRGRLGETSATARPAESGRRPAAHAPLARRLAGLPILDAGAAGAGLVVAAGGVGSLPALPANRWPLLALPGFMVLMLGWRGHYRGGLRRLLADEIVAVVGASSIAAMSVATANLVLSPRPIQGLPFVRFWFGSTAAVVAGRLVWAAISRVIASATASNRA